MLTLIPLYQDLVEKTVEEITARSGYDLSGFTVVSPSKRLLFFIKDRLYKTIDHSYFPPELLSIDQFVSKLFMMNHSGFKMINNMDSLFFTYRTVKESFGDTIYTGGKTGDCFPDFFPWTLVIRKAMEEILVESENVDQVDRDIYEKFTELGEYHLDYKDFITRLPGLVENFRKKLVDSRLFSRGLAYRMVSELAESGLLKVPDERDFIFTGMGMLNACEEKILKFMIHRGRVKILLKSDAAAIDAPYSPFRIHRHFLKMANPLPQTGEEETHWNRFSNRIRLYCQPNIESQMLQTAEILEKAVSGRNQEELKKIAVILPESSSLIPFVHGVVSRLIRKDNPLPFNITLGYPFVRTPLYQLLRFMLRTHESRRGGEFFHQDYLNLIRHPYVKLSGSIDHEEEPLKRGIHLIEEIINRDHLVFFNLQDIEDRVNQILTDSEDLDSQLKTQVSREIRDLHARFIIPGTLTLEELGGFLRQALRYIARNRGNQLFLGEYISSAIQTLDQVIEFARKNKDEVGYTDFSSLISLISYCFSESFVYFEGSPLKGIQVMGVLESRGLDFEEVILIDVMEGVFPQRLKYDPVLPYDIRQIFKVRGYREWETLFAFNFFSLIGSAKKIHLLWLDNQEGMQRTEKSRFIERIIFETEKRGEPSLPVIRSSCPFGLKAGSLTKVVKTGSIMEKIRGIRFSPSMLETYIRCPLRFYFSYVMGLRERDEITADPDSGELGTLIHSVLEAFYRISDLPRTRTDIEANLESLLKQGFENRGFGLSSGTGMIRFWVLKEKLVDFIQMDCRRLKEHGIRIQDLEKRISVNFTFPFSSRPVSIRGRIDRIEKEGQVLRLIDYKTGTPFNPRVKPEMKAFRIDDLFLQNESLYLDRLQDIRKTYKNFQILLYCLLVEREYGLQAEFIDALYVFLKPADDFFHPVFIYGRKKEEWTAKEKKPIMDNFNHNLMEIIRDVVEGKAFWADPRDSEYCSFCPFRIPCGNMG